MRSAIRERQLAWSYAQNFVLQDSMFAASASWSLPEHLSTVSGWSASCPEGDTNPMHCTSTINPPHQGANLTRVTNAWTDDATLGIERISSKPELQTIKPFHGFPLR